MKAYSNFADFAEANKDTMFRFLVYRRMFTPEEQEKKFIDQSFFEDIYFAHGKIEEVLPLGNGDWLIGFRMWVDDEECHERSYFRLSEIRLSWYDCDQDGYEEKEDDSDWVY